MRSIPDMILNSNARPNVQSIKRVLIVYHDDEFYLGDNCIILYKLGLCRNFFGSDASLDINFVNPEYHDRYQGICQNNPQFTTLIFKDFSEVDFNAYDVVLFIAPDEEIFVEHLQGKYAEAAVKPSFAVYSLSKAVFALKESTKEPVFPFFEELYDYAVSVANQPYELYISAEEKEWANKWLEENGIDEDSNLFILADYTSQRDKLMRHEVYFQVLIYLLSRKNSTVLIFDETDMGKEQFYAHWLEGKYMNRLLFVNGFSLRHALCITSSDYVKMVFGPCTGLLHCASGIYNRFVQEGMNVSKAPAIITYTGPWDAHYWWNNSPLVDCLLLRSVDSRKQMALLRELSEDEKKSWEGRLPCSEYTGEMIIEFIEKRLSKAGQASHSYLQVPA